MRGESITPSIDVVRVKPKYILSEYDFIGLLLTSLLSMLIFDPGTSRYFYVTYIVVIVHASIVYLVKKDSRQNVFKDHFNDFIDYIIYGGPSMSRLEKLAVFEEYKGDTYWFTENRTIGISFEVDFLDLDTDGTAELQKRVGALMRLLGDRTMILFNFVSRPGESLDVESSRCQNINEVGFNRQKLIVHIYEYRIPLIRALMSKTNVSSFNNTNNISDIKKLLDVSKSLNASEVKNYLDSLPIFDDSKNGLCLDSERSDYKSILKIEEIFLSSYEPNTLAHALESIAPPFDVFFKACKLSRGESMLKNQLIKNQGESGKEKVDVTKEIHASDTEAEIRAFNQRYVKWEMQFVLSDTSLNALKEREKYLIESVAGIGELKRQTYGKVDCINSVRPGTDFHCPINYKLSDIYSLFPWLSTTVKRRTQINNRSLLFHRANGTIDAFDCFNPRYDHFSGIVSGASGSGKSMFVNLLLDALAFDKKNHIMLVDVKASHHRKIESLGGKVIEMSIDSHPKFNPFSILHYSNTQSSIVMLTNHLEKLYYDDNKCVLDAEEKARLSLTVADFAEKAKSDDLNFEGFLRLASDIPKRVMIERFGKKGLYNIYSNEISTFQGREITYFSLKDLQSASNSEVSSILMSAVEMQYYTLLNAKSNDERLMFINDETIFFIESFKENYEFLSTNLRGFNGGILLIVQYLEQISKHSTDLLEHISYSISFKPKGKDTSSRESMISKIAKIHQVDTSVAELICDLHTEKGVYANFALIDIEGVKRGRIITSLSEYWVGTTKPEDKYIVEQTMKALKISEPEARQVMVFAHRLTRRENYAY